jgi:exodeoxyribonuclease VII small subunit
MAESPDTPPSPPQPPVPQDELAGLPFEAGLAELNDIVGRLESGGLGLSESIVAYERGVSILRHLHTQLADVEDRVRLLVRIDEQGRPILDSALEEPAGVASGLGAAGGGESAPRRGARSASRPARPKRLPGMEEETRSENP